MPPSGSAYEEAAAWALKSAGASIHWTMRRRAECTGSPNAAVYITQGEPTRFGPESNGHYHYEVSGAFVPCHRHLREVKPVAK